MHLPQIHHHMASSHLSLVFSESEISAHRGWSEDVTEVEPTFWMPVSHSPYHDEAAVDRIVLLQLGAGREIETGFVAQGTNSDRQVAFRVDQSEEEEPR